MLALDKNQEILIDHVGVAGEHAVRVAGIDLRRPMLEELGSEQRCVPVGHALIVVPVHHQGRHRAVGGRMLNTSLATRCRRGKGLFRSPPYQLGGWAAARGVRLSVFELICIDREVDSLLVHSDPIWKSATLDVEVQIGTTDRIGTEVGQASFYRGLVLGRGALGTIV